MKQKVTLIKGDGVGPELAEAARQCIDATGARIEWDVCEAGLDVMDREGTPLPDRTLHSVETTHLALKAPITTPVVNGLGSINVHLRRHFDLFACVRPCKSYPGLPGKYQDIDLVVVRENTEGLYAGIEFEQNSTPAQELIAWINDHRETPLAVDAALSIRPTSPQATRRILRFAFDYAKRTGRRKVTSAHKANLLKASDGMWLEISREVAKQYPDILFEDCLVDSLCMRFVQDPTRYDVIVVPNLYGDIISDLASGMVGGLGMAPSAHAGAKTVLFEAVHGGIPQYKGKDMANPAALILSGMLLLRHLQWHHEADKLERAVADVIAEGKRVTFDLAQGAPSPKPAGTTEMVEAIMAKLR